MCGVELRCSPWGLQSVAVHLVYMQVHGTRQLGRHGYRRQLIKVPAVPRKTTVCASTSAVSADIAWKTVGQHALCSLGNHNKPRLLGHEQPACTSSMERVPYRSSVELRISTTCTSTSMGELYICIQPCGLLGGLHLQGRGSQVKLGTWYFTLRTTVCVLVYNPHGPKVRREKQGTKKKMVGLKLKPCLLYPTKYGVQVPFSNKPPIFQHQQRAQERGSLSPVFDREIRSIAACATNQGICAKRKIRCVVRRVARNIGCKEYLVAGVVAFMLSVYSRLGHCPRP